ncbi:hypothetical protein TNCV_2003811 [Trichonephila clavipes]|nr:hypothetical protein TNCV_2003811 [Trichonephila clavipes]
MQDSKRRSCELRCKEAKKKQKHINGTENIVLKDFTTTGARNCDQKSPGKHDSGAAWNSLHSGKSLACHVSFQHSYRYSIPSTEGTCISYTKLYVNPEEVHGTFEQLFDEVHFWLNGYVNKQNCRIWSEANSQVYVETPFHPDKLTVWCALWAGGILQKR